MNLQEKIQDEFKDYSQDTPGANIAVVKDGEVIEAHSFGLASLEHRVPNDRETVFYIASVSKQFVACSIALLEADGSIKLDDDIRTYFPELTGLPGRIEVYNLLHHTSGIRDKYALAMIGGLPEETYSTDAGTMKLIGGQRSLNFAPGSRMLYSNSGYWLLAQIVERVSNKKLREFTDERIFKPLGMSKTIFRDDPSLVIPKRASGYFKRGGEWKLAEYTWASLGAGGVFTTVDDLAKWDAVHYGDKLGALGFHERLLTTRPLNDGRPNNYAFGLMVDKLGDKTLVHHGGGVSGYSAEMMRIPELRTGVLCLANSSSVGASVRARSVMGFLAGYEPSEKSIETEEIEIAPWVAPAILCSEDVTVVAELARNNGDVVLKAGGQTIPLRATSPTSFSGPGGLKIESDENGANFADRRFVRLSEPTRKLPDYTGSYHSAELGVTVDLAIKDGELVASGRGDRPEKMRQVSDEVFVLQAAVGQITGEAAVRFELNPDPVAFEVGIDRAFGVRFDRT